jgi:hypothetical protein
MNPTCKFIGITPGLHSWDMISTNLQSFGQITATSFGQMYKMFSAACSSYDFSRFSSTNARVPEYYKEAVAIANAANATSTPLHDANHQEMGLDSDLLADVANPQLVSTEFCPTVVEQETPAPAPLLPARVPRVQPCGYFDATISDVERTIDGMVDMLAEIEQALGQKSAEILERTEATNKKFSDLRLKLNRGGKKEGFLDEKETLIVMDNSNRDPYKIYLAKIKHMLDNFDVMLKNYYVISKIAGFHYVDELEKIHRKYGNLSHEYLQLNNALMPHHINSAYVDKLQALYDLHIRKLVSKL